MKKKPKVKPELIQALLLFLFALVFFSERYSMTMFNIFQGRDIRRAYDLLQGNLIWYGPDLSGGSHTPGPFYYWLLALPLSVFKTWQSLVWFNIALFSAAAVVLWFVGSALAGAFTGFLLYFFFLSSRFFVEQMMAFWNPSFLYFFQAVIIYWSVKDEKKSSHLILSGLLLGLTLQIHYIQLIFLIALIGSLALKDKWNQKKVKTILTVAIFALLPLVPFFIWSFLQASHVEAYGKFSGAASTIFYPVVHFLNEPSDFFTKVFRNITEIISTDVNKEAFLPFLLGSWVAVFVSAIRKEKAPITNNRFLWLAWAVAALFCFQILYDLHFKRYGSPFLLLFYVLSVSHLEWLEKKYRFWFFTLLAVTFCISLWILPVRFSLIPFSIVPFIFVLIALTVAMFFAFRLTGRQRLALAPFWFMSMLLFIRMSTMAPNRMAYEREGLLRTVIQKTGWDYKTFRERAFIAGVHREEEYEVIYEQIRKENSSASKIDVDGVLAVFRKAGRLLDNGLLNWENVIEDIPLEIYSAGRSGDLICRETFSAGRFDVCLYKFNDPTAHYTWNNVGYPYVFRQPPLSPVSESSGSVRLGKTRWLFYKNACASLEPSCTIYFLVESAAKKFLEITVLGDPLGMPNPAPNPAWYFTAKNPSLEVTCNKKSDSNIFVSKLGIGINPNGGFTPGFLTPFQSRVPADCEVPNKISVVINDGFSGTINRGWNNAPFKLTWEEN